ncbi:MAG: hypothetical protein GY705_20410 [Bacteroidetes bacterium]|nr:hypothetical protein [Bacteroidota bacterium]
MSISSDVLLTQDALSLKNLDKLSVKLVLEWNVEELMKTLQEFMDLKKKIKKEMIECPVAKIHNNIAKEVLRKISQSDEFQTEKILKGIENKTGASFEFDKLDLEEADDDEMRDLFYSWFSHYEYSQGLYEIGSLVVSYSVPDALKSYVSEARSCYAFQQYNAVYGLCRTILEIAIRHRCERMGIIKRNEKIEDFESYRPSVLINKSTRGPLRDKVKDIYSDTSTLLHGRKIVRKEDAIKMFKDALSTVQDF